MLKELFQRSALEVARVLRYMILRSVLFHWLDFVNSPSPAILVNQEEGSGIQVNVKAIRSK